MELAGACLDHFLASNAAKNGRQGGQNRSSTLGKGLENILAIAEFLDLQLVWGVVVDFLCERNNLSRGSIIGKSRALSTVLGDVGVHRAKPKMQQTRTTKPFF